MYDIEQQRREQAVEYPGEEVISFAQNREDVLLYRAFKGKRNGFLTVPLESIVAIVEQYCSNVAVDFVKIDVEGLDTSVLSSVDWTNFRPAVVCVEAVQPNSAIPSHAAWEPLLTSRDYFRKGTLDDCS